MALRTRTTRSILGALVVVPLLGACGKTPAPASRATGAWNVSGGFVRDPQGRAVVLRGVQISGDQKAAPYIDAETFADYQRLRDDWGFDSLRFLMVWAAIEPQEGQYDDAYLDQLAERATWAQQLGLSVILDMHQDVYGEGFGFDGAPKWACDASYYAAFKPTTPWGLDVLDPNVQACTDQLYTSPDTLGHFTEAWRRVAQRLAGIPSIVGFDVLNEPEWGTYSIESFEADRLQPFYESVVKVVRAEAPQWIAFLEPAASRNLGVRTGLTPFSFGNVVYAPHSYDETAETSGSFPLDDAPHVVSNIEALQAEAQSLGAALWIGEYGGQWNDPNIGAYMGADYDGIGAVAGGSDLLGLQRRRRIQPRRRRRHRAHRARRRGGAPRIRAHRGRSGLVRVRRDDLDVHVRVPARRERRGADRDRRAGPRLSRRLSRRLRRLRLPGDRVGRRD